jgi:hypothetical protein
MKLFVLLLMILFSTFSLAQECSVIPVPSLVGEVMSAADLSLRGPSTPACSVDKILNCDLFENSSEAFIQTGTGETIPNLTRMAPGVTEDGLTPANRRTLVSTFSLVKDSIKEEILQGRRLADLSSYEKSLYNRIDTIKLDEGFQPCRTSRPNGQYMASRHSLMLCPGFLKLPQAALVKVMAHEISHSIDYCNMLTPFYERVSLPATSPIAGRDRYFVFSSLLERFEYKKSDVESAIAAGQIRRLDVGGKGENYPLVTRLTCLEKLKHPEETSFALASNEQCSQEQTSAGEDAAELWSSKILGKFLKTHPFRSELEKQALLFEAVGSKCKAAASANGKKPNVGNQGSHSDDRFRLNEIFLSNPAIQEAMGCTPIPKVCDPN